MRLILAIWLCLSAVAAPPLFRAQNIPGGGFLPSDLPDLALWLDADDASTLTLSGSVVDEWRDKSGNGRDFTGSGSARPTVVSAAYNGRDVIQFDGVNDVLALPSDSLGRNVGGYSVYAVYKFNAAPATQQVVFFVTTSVSNARMLLDAGVTPDRDRYAARRLDAGSAASVTASSAPSTSVYEVRAFTFDCGTGNLDAYLNGSLVGSNSIGGSGNSTDGDTNGSFIGGNGLSLTVYAAMNITEILVYHAVHDTSTRAQVEAYLTR